jgi:hypothetical protein
MPFRRSKTAAKSGLAATLMRRMPSRGRGLLALGGLVAGAAAAAKARGGRGAHEHPPSPPPPGAPL